MSVFNRRTRIISFRLSEQEYENLRTVCLSRGIRSIADLARLAAQECAATNGESLGDGSLAAWVRQLQGRVTALDSEVKRLWKGMEPQPAPAEGPGFTIEAPQRLKG